MFQKLSKYFLFSLITTTLFLSFFMLSCTGSSTTGSSYELVLNLSYDIEKTDASGDLYTPSDVDYIYYSATQVGKKYPALEDNYDLSAEDKLLTSITLSFDDDMDEGEYEMVISARSGDYSDTLEEKDDIVIANFVSQDTEDFPRIEITSGEDEYNLTLSGPYGGLEAGFSSSN